MTTVTKDKLLKEELRDLQRLIDIDSQLLEKYPVDNLLRITLQQYMDRRTALLRMLAHLLSPPPSATHNGQISIMIDSPSTIDEKQMNELKIRTVL